MAEESTPAEEEKPKRHRRTKAEMQSTLPPFDPSLVEGRLSVTAKRVVRTGPYESFDIMVHLDFERDPRFSVLENVTMLNSLCVQECNRAADLVQSQVQVEK